MHYKTIMICVLLAGTMQNTWGIGETNTPLGMLNTLVSEHGALCASKEFEDVMLRIAMFRKNLQHSNNPDMSLVNKVADALTIDFQAALAVYQNNHNK